MNAPLHDNARTLVLTGASRGIGHATVKKFSAGGWRVITVSRQPFSALCPWPGGDKNHVQIDLADPADLSRGIDDIRDRLGGGKLDALVNNAAISPKDETGGRFGDELNPGVALPAQGSQPGSRAGPRRAYSFLPTIPARLPGTEFFPTGMAGSDEGVLEASQGFQWR